MGMAGDDGCDAGGVRMQIQILARVKHVDQVSIEIDGFGGRQLAAHSAVVNIAANCSERCDGPQSVENIVIPDIAGMQDVGATGESVHGLWAQ